MAVLSRKKKKGKAFVPVLQISQDTMRKLGSIKRYKGRIIDGVPHIQIGDVWHPVSNKSS